MNIQEKIAEYKKLENEIYEKVYAVNQIMGKIEKYIVKPYRTIIGEGHVYDFEPDFVMMEIYDRDGNDYYNIPRSFLDFDLTTYSGFRGLVRAIKEDREKKIEKAKREQEERDRIQTEDNIKREKDLYDFLRKKFENS